MVSSASIENYQYEQSLVTGLYLYKQINSWKLFSALDVSFIEHQNYNFLDGKKHREKSDTFWVKKSASRHFEKQKLLGSQGIF